MFLLASTHIVLKAVRHYQAMSGTTHPTIAFSNFKGCVADRRAKESLTAHDSSIMCRLSYGFAKEIRPGTAFTDAGDPMLLEEEVTLTEQLSHHMTLAAWTSLESLQIYM